MITKLFTAALAFSCLALAGCDTLSDYRVKDVDGHQFIMNWPVVATGEVEDVRITEKNGTVHNVAKGAGSVAGEYAGSTRLLTDLGGMSNLGAGAVAGGIGAVFDIIAAVNAPRIELMVRRSSQGDLINVPVSADTLKIAEKMHCVQIGDNVNVVKRGRAFDVYNVNQELLRLSDFQPSCDELRAKASATKLD